VKLVLVLELVVDASLFVMHECQSPPRCRRGCDDVTVFHVVKNVAEERTAPAVDLRTCNHVPLLSDLQV